MGTQDPLENVELTAAVQGLRDQLMAAVDASDGRPIRFEVEEINLEFAVELRRDAQIKAGFKAWVVSGDSQAGAARTAAHKVSVKLRPKKSRDGGPVEIGNQDDVSMEVFGAPLDGHRE
ncbi:hypothetical protein DF17_28670 [Streptomyces rimosus]|uniref:trypco2 family protein n=1 Tax=Streptomyces rimosus TaxID=1927 RepID=UPI0004D85B72|nr:trypco2 family protein [Streptomyces rimosus]KEF03415.1 hypothetical protein DF17_28670 [Streptomyces rimosus]